MADIFTPQRRSEIMANIHSADTTPEVELRRLIRALGYRFRLHRADLPGPPDIVLARHRATVLMHGCFWHGHTCRDGRRPGSNTDFWNKKLDRNVLRDQQTVGALRGEIGLEMPCCLGMLVEGQGTVEGTNNPVSEGIAAMKTEIASLYCHRLQRIHMAPDERTPARARNAAWSA